MFPLDALIELVIKQTFVRPVRHLDLLDLLDLLDMLDLLDLLDLLGSVLTTPVSLSVYPTLLKSV